MHISRQIKDTIIDQIKSSKKIIIIFGARQTGKTTLINEIISELGLKTLSVDGDQLRYVDVLSSRDFNRLNSLVEGYELLFIDEAQHIPDIGINLKILYDKKPELRIIVSGSSSLNIASKVSESLTGRKFTYKLYPVSVKELQEYYNEFEIREKLEELMVYGSYPEVLTTVNYQQKIKLLEEIGNSYLFKDLFELTDIRQKNKLRELLRLISYQVGHEVSIHELSQTLSLSRPAVENYLNLLEESFIIFHLSAFSRNLRKEVSKMNKYYFCDPGIRNLLINNFNLLENRNDTGQLWENFLITQKIIQSENDPLPSATYFWRTYTGAEIDFIEEKAGRLTGYEIKYNKSKIRPPKTWIETYDAVFILINKDNFLDYI